MPNALQLVQSRDWDGLKNRLKPVCPQCRSNDRSGVYLSTSPALHYACVNKNVPSDIITMLMYNSALQKDENGNSSLHAACAGSVATTKQILDHYFIKNENDTIFDKNQDNLAPMHIAWLKHMQIDFALLDEASVDKTTAAANIIEMDKIDDLDDLEGSLMDLWDKTTLLLFVSNSKSMYLPLGGRQWRVVHQIAASGGKYCYCPTVVMWFALKLYAVQCRQQDENGNFPLHIAASNSRHPVLDISYPDSDGEDIPDSDGEDITNILNQAHVPVLKMLLQQYPRAAKIQTREGRIPLNLAIESGKRWDGGVKDLMEAAPEALGSRDIKTHLYPFMLAASSTKSKVDVVFGLLRTHPEMVKGGIQETHFEKYLQEKLEEAQKKLDKFITTLPLKRKRLQNL